MANRRRRSSSLNSDSSSSSGSGSSSLSKSSKCSAHSNAAPVLNQLPAAVPQENVPAIDPNDNPNVDPNVDLDNNIRVDVDDVDDEPVAVHPLVEQRDLKILVTPADAVALAKSKAEPILSDDVKCWLVDLALGVRMSIDLCAAFKLKYKPLNNVLLDLMPRRDEPFTEGCKFATPSRASVDIHNLKALTDNLFELDKVFIEMGLIPFLLGDLVAIHKSSAKDLPADGLKQQYATLTKDTFKAIAWLASKMSQARLFVHSMHRMLCLAPWFKNLNKRQIEAISKELMIVSVRKRTSKETDAKYPNKDSAPPLLFGSTLLKKMRRRIKNKKQADKVVGDLLGNVDNPRKGRKLSRQPINELWLIKQFVYHNKVAHTN